jgi:hypothetical protein
MQTDAPIKYDLYDFDLDAIQYDKKTNEIRLIPKQ